MRGRALCLAAVLALAALAPSAAADPQDDDDAATLSVIGICHKGHLIAIQLEASAPGKWHVPLAGVQDMQDHCPVSVPDTTT